MNSQGKIQKLVQYVILERMALELMPYLQQRMVTAGVGEFSVSKCKRDVDMSCSTELSGVGKLSEPILERRYAS